MSKLFVSFSLIRYHPLILHGEASPLSALLEGLGPQNSQNLEMSNRTEKRSDSCGGVDGELQMDGFSV